MCPYEQGRLEAFTSGVYCKLVERVCCSEQAGKIPAHLIFMNRLSDQLRNVKVRFNPFLWYKAAVRGQKRNKLWLVTILIFNLRHTRHRQLHKVPPCHHKDKGIGHHMILPVLCWHVVLNLSSLYNWEYSANIKRVIITQSNMMHKCYTEWQTSTLCTDVNASKCTGIEIECCLSHPEMWHDKNRQITGIQHSIKTHMLYCALTQTQARVSILFVLAEGVTSGCPSVRLL